MSTKDTIALSVRLEPEIHQELRAIAFMQRKPMQRLLMEGVLYVLERERAAPYDRGKNRLTGARLPAG